MVSKEKLVDGTLASIMPLICDCLYNEHNILIYPDVLSFREIYTQLTRNRIKQRNDMVLILPHYETAKAVEQALMELDVRAKDEINQGSLEIVDSYHAFFDEGQTFSQFASAAANDSRRNGKSGVIIIADMGSFFHRQAIELLIAHECKIPASHSVENSTIFCCYNLKDFQKLTKVQEERLCENHYRNLFVRSTEN